jgi:hypothetical protein
VGATRIQHKEGEKKREMEVKSIMDGSEKKKGTPSTTFLSLDVLKGMMRKTKDDLLEGYYYQSDVCMYNRRQVCILLIQT